MGFSCTETVLRQALGDAAVDSLLSLHLMSFSPVNPSWLVPHVQLFPLDVNAGCDADAEPLHVLLATDLPPPYSAALTEEPVMYLSSCSIALVQHWRVAMQQQTRQTATERPVASVLDMCCGSGVQGICAAAADPHIAVTALDLSPRAVRFTRFNAALNGLSRRITAECSDLYAAVPAGQRFRAILANPPYIPVPPALNALECR